MQLVHGQQNTSDMHVNPHCERIGTYLESISEELWQVNTGIHANPELGLLEFKAHDLLTSFLESREGWHVTRSVGGIETAFAAVFEGENKGPTVSFNAEYDALPKLGHACGHNLITTSSLGAALAVAEMIRAEKIAGRVVLFGTPAEESHGGKVLMLEAGVFHDYNIDISLMAHPSTTDAPYIVNTCVERYDVEYKGVEAHASTRPFDGVNAQDALIIAYNAVSMLRQQAQPSDQFHGVIVSGGSVMNVIPNLATFTYGIRSKNKKDLDAWSGRIRKCFEAGALATGAELTLTKRPQGYLNVITNELLAQSYSRHYGRLGGYVPNPIADKAKRPMGATDQGNVSYAFPAIHPRFAIKNDQGKIPQASVHTAEFEKAAGTRGAFKTAIMVAKTLASVAVDVLVVPGMLDAVRDDFRRGLEAEEKFT